MQHIYMMAAINKKKSNTSIVEMSRIKFLKFIDAHPIINCCYFLVFQARSICVPWYFFCRWSAVVFAMQH